MLWHRQMIFESKGDKLSSSAECRIRTGSLEQNLQQTECPLTNRLSYRELNNKPELPRPYDQQAFSLPNLLLVGFHTWLIHTVLMLIEMLWHKQAIFESKWDYCFSHRFFLHCYTDIDRLWLPWYCPCSILTEWMTSWLNFKELNQSIKYNQDWLDTFRRSIAMSLSIAINKRKPILKVSIPYRRSICQFRFNERKCTFWNSTFCHNFQSIWQKCLIFVIENENDIFNLQYQ